MYTNNENEQGLNSNSIQEKSILQSGSKTCETCLGMTRNSVRVRRSSEMMSIAADSHACYIHIMTLTVLYSHYFFPFRSFLLEFIIKLITRFIISHQKVATICFQWAEC